jgi:hypothetical protein
VAAPPRAAEAGAAATGIERPRALSVGALGAAATVALALGLTGCGGSGSDPASGSGDPASERQAVIDYVARVEPIRLGVNRLLDRADPIMSAYREHRLGAGEAQRRMDALERRFAAYAVKIAALHPVPAALREAQRAYAHTYVFEDAYLSALAAAIPERDFEDLPQTQDRQRAAITAWRIRLQVVANRLGIHLPRDLQAAGRGEIAPSPLGE